MAEQEGRWITVNGAHVFLKDGESENPFAKLKKTVDKSEYENDKKNIEDLMKKDYDEGTFLSVRAGLIEKIRKGERSADYDVLLGKLERHAQNKFGYSDEDMEKMAYQGTRVKLGSLSKYNAHPSVDPVVAELKAMSDKNNYDFERVMNHEMRIGKLRDATEIKVNGTVYKKVNGGWEAFERGKRIWTGTINSVAGEVSRRLK